MDRIQTAFLCNLLPFNSCQEGSGFSIVEGKGLGGRLPLEITVIRWHGAQQICNKPHNLETIMNWHSGHAVLLQYIMQTTKEHIGDSSVCMKTFGERLLLHGPGLRF